MKKKLIARNRIIVKSKFFNTMLTCAQLDAAMFDTPATHDLAKALPSMSNGYLRFERDPSEYSDKCTLACWVYKGKTVYRWTIMQLSPSQMDGFNRALNKLG